MTTARIPLNDTARLFARHADEIGRVMGEIAASGYWLNGPHTRRFAQEFAAYVGVPHCIPVANGTDALEIAMRALLQVRGIERREVVTVANAGGYSATAAQHVGLVPVFADVDPATLLIDIASAVAALGADTALVVATHLYGGAVDVGALRAAMNARGFAHVPILEDCAQAHGVRCGQVLAGAAGDIATFSFYPTKNLGAMGDAGAIVTADAALAETVTRLHQYGWTAKYRIGLAGGRNSRMDELQAGILSTLLPHLDAMNARRVAILDAYVGAASADVALVRAPQTVAHLAIAMVEAPDRFRAFLDARGIASDVHYPILDCDQPAWPTPRLTPSGVEVARRSVARIVTLPCFAFLEDGEVERICASLRDYTA
ncbi:DegT/DnrJ/EryC1/StrS aminotransferase family protein [Ancylobacter sp. TS-1]|uniref:DegT/DnrJ/EryC1/StrS family aminotransferase n=1 Tax=Ancylobacter sp. TS-1 TaxID=1850374 RepID=UPI001265B4D8|nr:DegT/DnrJ/EryC1/StrS family aminotransferase [Ancylobacter sp. TS-1]QFR34589.1 erythromycin biosynthesis sensory transduction protein eryC1 [Ancylobacter sp. TS-1]